MNCITINKVIEIRYEILGIDGYVFCSDRKLYNIRTNREIKMTINCRSKGYWLKRKFYTLNKLKSLLIRPKNFNLPF